MCQNPKVAVLASRFPEISETFVMQHVTGLVERGVDVKVLANSGDAMAWSSLGQYATEIRERVWHYRMPASKRQRVSGALGKIIDHSRRRMWGYLSSFNVMAYGGKALSLQLPYVFDQALAIGPVDILHCHFGFNGVLGAHLKRLGFCRHLVVTFHGIDVSKVLDQAGNHHPYSVLFEHADLILPISHRWEKKLIELGAPADRVQVHRVGIDVDRFKYQERKSRDGSLRLATTARFTEKKGLRYAIEAVALLRRIRPDLLLRYDIIGSGAEWNDINQLIDRLGVRDLVNLHGPQPHHEVETMLAQADAFVLPSVTAANGDQEGIPVSLMEAMASGMPVLSTWHSGIPELVEDGVSGFLVPERDPEMLAERIAYLADHPDRWREMGYCGRVKVESGFNLLQQNDSLLALYLELMSSQEYSSSSGLVRIGKHPAL